MPSSIFISVLCAVSIGATEHYQYRIINSDVDELIIDYNKNVFNYNGDTIRLNDLNCSYGEVFGYKFNMFRATGGTAKYLSTASRRGDAIAMSTPTSVHLTLRGGLDRLEITYKNSFVSVVFGEIPTGGFTVLVERNSVGFELTLYLNGDSCVPIVDKYWLEYFDGLDIRMEGGGWYSWFSNKILHWLAGNLKKIIEDRFESEFAGFVAKYMREKSFCDILNYIKI
ncbi:hypothetical protein J6590_096706 [Homalodisca vitripennis]|nr:hypothetical protein J6590_094231 [Homalodisca vitripennis]KAG8324248.1 hypothetical protein J6590_096706 [Homalodisca vitripennis]